MFGTPLHFSPTKSQFLLFICPLAVAWLGALLGTWASIRVARRLGHFDLPGERSSHSAPVPRFGGAGIALGFFLALAWFAPRTADAAAYLRAIWIGGLFALAFGLFDDVHGLPALPKLACQLIAAAAPVALGLSFAHLVLNDAAVFSLGMAGRIAAFVWILFYMNAFNFMDGMDGQTASFGIATALALAFPLLLAWHTLGEPHLHALVLIALAGALYGFMPFNTHCPALTFMGDGGSQLVGYLLALALVAMPEPLVPAGFLAFWPFVYDVGFTLIKRTLRGENLLAAHREHLYQRLLRAGLTHRQSLGRGLLFEAVCFGASISASLGWLFTHTQRAFMEGAAIVLLATLVYTAHVLMVEKRAATRRD